MSSEIREAFERTECGCNRCSTGCKTMPGALAPDDYWLIAHYLDVPDHELQDFITNHFCASTGSAAVIMGKRTIIPTIVPKQKEDGSCVFFKDGKCSVHTVAPFGCAYFDHHMHNRQADIRTKAYMLACLTSEPYQLMWSLLNLMGCVASPIETRKNAMRKALLEIEDGDKTGSRDQGSDRSRSDSDDRQTTAGKNTQSSADDQRTGASG